jgi:hypothetical protein
MIQGLMIQDLLENCRGLRSRQEHQRPYATLGCLVCSCALAAIRQAHWSAVTVQGKIFTPTNCGASDCDKANEPLVAKVMCDECTKAYDEVRPG